uniref:Uncharacterized protein n=1 Tax=Arundo donax TaxID=35708 RepID=A0A0A9GKS6_ARUDO
MQIHAIYYWRHVINISKCNIMELNIPLNAF